MFDGNKIFIWVIYYALSELIVKLDTLIYLRDI